MSRHIQLTQNICCSWDFSRSPRVTQQHAVFHVNFQIFEDPPAIFKICLWFKFYLWSQNKFCIFPVSFTWSVSLHIPWEFEKNRHYYTVVGWSVLECSSGPNWSICLGHIQLYSGHPFQRILTSQWTRQEKGNKTHFALKIWNILPDTFFIKFSVCIWWLFPTMRRACSRTRGVKGWVTSSVGFSHILYDTCMSISSTKDFLSLLLIIHNRKIIIRLLEHLQLFILCPLCILRYQSLSVVGVMEVCLVVERYSFNSCFRSNQAIWKTFFMASVCCRQNVNSEWISRANTGCTLISCQVFQPFSYNNAEAWSMGLLFNFNPVQRSLIGPRRDRWYACYTLTRSLWVRFRHSDTTGCSYVWQFEPWRHSSVDLQAWCPYPYWALGRDSRLSLPSPGWRMMSCSWESNCFAKKSH